MSGASSNWSLQQKKKKGGISFSKEKKNPELFVGTEPFVSFVSCKSVRNKGGGASREHEGAAEQFQG